MRQKTMHKKPRCIIAGGGTGGHVFPAIAIANALKPVTGTENILFLGAKGKMEMQKVPAAGFSIVALPITGLQGKINRNNLLLPFRIASSLWKSMGTFLRFRPDVVIGVGGYASAPALVTARILGIPYVIQEQNSIPGKVNRRMGQHARLVCTAFPDMEKFFRHTRVVLTGNPVRKIIASSHSVADEAYTAYSLDKAKPVLLVIGGSQGSRSINQAILQCLEPWMRQDIQVIWQTGTDFAPIAEQAVKARNLKGVTVVPFIDRMDLAYGAATLVVSRAGALAIAEIAIANLPSILIPFPFAAEDHQSYNAKAMAAQGASLTLTDKELSENLCVTVSNLITDPVRLAAMRLQSKKMAYPIADEEIANLILETAGYHDSSSGTATPDPEKVSSVYFLGAGGIGMSGLARWFLLKGKHVCGYDKTPTPLTQALEKEGMTLHFEDRPDLIPADTELVVLTPAIPKNLAERRFVEQSGIPVVKRAALLGMISGNLKTIAVAGTHGKTSTTALITHLLKNAGIPVTGFIGGITKNYNNNFVFTPESQYMVVEADEFDRSFLHLHPDFSIITSTDADHLDIYGTHDQLKAAFVEFGNLNGRDKPLLISGHVHLDFGKPVDRYSADNLTVENRAENIRDQGATALFDLVLGDMILKDITLGIPGRHNIENAVAASTAALWAGVNPDQLREGLATYQGVVRRFDIRINEPDLVYIDDYAHHPRELAACIDAARKIWPDKKITGIFQPHLFSRTRDFADEFAKSLDKLDEVILLDIYPAREEPIPGVSSDIIYEKLQCPEKHLITKKDVIRQLKLKKPEVLLTLGAGDIDTLVSEIEALFAKNPLKS